MGIKKIKLALAVVFVVAGICCLNLCGCSSDSTNTSSASGSAK